MTYIGKNLILISIWSVIVFLIITTKTSQMLLTILFTVFVLDLSENLVDKYISNSKKYKKILSILFSLLSVFIVIVILYKSFTFMALDLNTLINQSQDTIITELKKLGINNIENISEIYQKLTNLIKENLVIVTTGASLLIKVFIGIILGLLFHFTTIEEYSNKNLEGKIINDLKSHSILIYTNFKNIMEIQILISLMNTIIISIMALGLTYLWSGEFLPYWYVIIPLTAILSLIPVVGNVLINIILMMSTIQISVLYVFVGIGMFLFIHKLELLVIGNKMKEKMNLPFIFIIISMILGEFLFHSMSGMLLGMVITTTLLSFMRKIEYKN